MRLLLITLALLGVEHPCAAPARAAEWEYDVVVYGGTSGGVSAAVQAARMGRTVILIEPGRHLGGLTSGGLGATDIGNKRAIGGISREFYQRVRTHYEDDANWKHEKRADFKGRGHEPKEDTAWTFEPHVAERIYNDFIREHKIPVVFGQRLDLAKGVQKDGPRIVAVGMESGQTYRGKMFIDATYEGDLLAKAGVSYHIGREANKAYGETLNGVQVRHATHHQFIQKVDPYVRPGDPSSGLLPRVHAGPPGADGEGDHRVQAYNFRLCATDRPENRRPWPKPENYDETQYELLLRNFEAGDHRLPWNPVLLPNRKTDSNNNFAFSTDDIGLNYAYPDGDYATREKIWNEHVDYQKGLLWTLANHPRVPEKVRRHFRAWGLARDEFADTDNWPHQLYVREARRMVGGYVMTEHNCRGLRGVEDSAGLAAYTMDSHHTQRYVTREGHVLNEGDVQVGGFPPYPISYRSLVPRAAECTNLLVPVCLSASHISYGSIRMEPVFMVLGQSAATAAALAIADNVAVQKVDYSKLRERLLRDRQVLDWTGTKRVNGAGAFSAAPAAETGTAERHLLYVAAPGIRNYPEFGGAGILVFDRDRDHTFVKRIATPASRQPKPENIKGICASAATRKLYFSTLTKLYCLDLVTDQTLWEKALPGGCDRMSIAPDGKLLYVPSLEGPHWNIIDGTTGEVVARVETRSGSHNTVCSVDGSRVYLAGLRSPLLSVLDTRTRKVVQTVGPFGAAIRPFTVNAAQTLCFVNVNGLLGFEVGDLRTGKLLHRVEVQGFAKGPTKRHGCPSHGIGLTPDEKEIWLCDAANSRLHVFDATALPPKQTASISLREQPGWVTFSLDGRFAYPSTGEVVDAKTKKILAALHDEEGRQVHSEKLLEIVFRDGVPVRAGDQFGLGRKAQPARPTPQE